MNLICPVCKTTNLGTFYQSLSRCRDCGMITASVEPSAEAVKAMYESQYFNGDEYSDYLGDKHVIQRNMRKWLSVVRQYVPSGVLVEVACAYGFFLELAQHHFTVKGYDVAKEVVSYARQNLRVPVTDVDFLSDDSLAPGSVDVIVMWDFLEHAAQPRQFIERAERMLRPGGYLFMTTGDIDSWMARRQGPSWRLIHPPTHLQYFSQSTLTRLLNQYRFDSVNVSYPGYWRSIGQILHGMFVFGRSGKPSIIHRVLSCILPLRLGVYINTFDIMLMVARKAL